MFKDACNIFDEPHSEETASLNNYLLKSTFEVEPHKSIDLAKSTMHYVS